MFNKKKNNISYNNKPPITQQKHKLQEYIYRSSSTYLNNQTTKCLPDNLATNYIMFHLFCLPW